jgi:hypothetical protein
MMTYTVMVYLLLINPSNQVPPHKYQTYTECAQVKQQTIAWGVKVGAPVQASCVPVQETRHRDR